MSHRQCDHVRRDLNVFLGNLERGCSNRQLTHRIIIIEIETFKNI